MAVSDYRNSFLTIKRMSSSYHPPQPPPKLAPHFPGSPNGRKRTEDLPPRLAVSSFSSPQNSNLIIIIIIFYSFFSFFQILSSLFLSSFQNELKSLPRKSTLWFNLKLNEMGANSTPISSCNCDYVVKINCRKNSLLQFLKRITA